MNNRRLTFPRTAELTNLFLKVGLIVAGRSFLVVTIIVKINQMTIRFGRGSPFRTLTRVTRGRRTWGQI